VRIENGKLPERQGGGPLISGPRHHAPAKVGRSAHEEIAAELPLLDHLIEEAEQSLGLACVVASR
jgi:hypothetical protein